MSDTGEAQTVFVVPHKLCITVCYPLPAKHIFCMAVTQVKKCLQNHVASSVYVCVLV